MNREQITSGDMVSRSPHPMAMISGDQLLIAYANPAFGQFFGMDAAAMEGVAFQALMPGTPECLVLLKQTLSDGQVKSLTELNLAPNETLYRRYYMWPVAADNEPARPKAVVLQITRVSASPERATSMNEALILSAVKQHEFAEEAVQLNATLRAEIQERLRAELQVEQLAFHDVLTGLPNRRLVLDRLHHAYLGCSRTLRHGAVFFLDLDRFKELNDTHGHHMGDLLLQSVGLRLRQCVREHDTVARLGGDEFVVILENLSEAAEEAKAQALTVGEKMLAALAETHDLEGRNYHCTGSIGFTLFHRNSESVDELVKHADLAMYQAKLGGKNRLYLFDREMVSVFEAEKTLETELRHAIELGQLRMYYQPQVDRQGNLMGVEALVRWEHPVRGLLLPGDFISFAESHGLTPSLGAWVLEHACLQLKSWERTPLLSTIKMAVNVSARDLAEADFVERTLHILRNTGIDPRRFVLELTERVMFESVAEIISKMNMLKAEGICFALDDFGIGFSSLSCLRQLPLSQLKIDRSFVGGIMTSRSDRVIASAVIQLGLDLGLTIVAEGVETEDQLEFLAAQGCTLYQGYLFARSQPAALFDS